MTSRQPAAAALEHISCGVRRLSVSGNTVRPRILTDRGGVATDDDASLMRALHDQHAAALRSYVVGLNGGDRARAEDVVQETMLRAWRRPNILAQSGGSARSWLFTVAKRIVIDEWRSARHRPELVTDEPPELSAPDATDTSADRAVVVEALRRLSSSHQQVLLECYFRGSTVAEAAAALGIPPGTVKSRSHYALQAFKAAVA